MPETYRDSTISATAGEEPHGVFRVGLDADFAIYGCDSPRCRPEPDIPF